MAIKKKYKSKKNGKNATGRPEKWTLTFCMKELNFWLNHILSEDGQDVVLIKELTSMRGYSHQKWSEMTKMWGENPKFLDLIKKIEDILEMRLYKAGLTNAASPAMTIFGLKNKYGWSDKNDISLKVDQPLFPDVPTDDSNK